MSCAFYHNKKIKKKKEQPLPPRAAVGLNTCEVFRVPGTANTLHVHASYYLSCLPLALPPDPTTMLCRNRCSLTRCWSLSELYTSCSEMVPALGFLLASAFFYWDKTSTAIHCNWMQMKKPANFCSLHTQTESTLKKKFILPTF